MSSVYIWIAGMGVIGLVSLLLFFYFFMQSLKLKRKLKYSNRVLILNWLMLLIPISSFSMMIYFFMNVKDQLIQFG
ncbi:hypothetical protein ACYSNW_09620 [Enterococcus sp. LJL99]